MPSASTIGTASGPTDQITGLIAKAASDSGVDFAYLFNQARVESKLNPHAKAKTSSASGLYQFTGQTWLATLKQHGSSRGLDWASSEIERRQDGSFWIPKPALRGPILDLRFDPAAASDMAAAFASDNRDFLANKLGKDPDSVDLYLAHFLGAGGALTFLENYAHSPNAPAALMLPRAAAANKPIFYKPDGTARSFAEIRDNFANKFASGVPTLSSAEAGSTISRRQITDLSHPTTSSRLSMFRDIAPMPKGLSLEFARKAYQRLQSLPAGTVG